MPVIVTMGLVLSGREKISALLSSLLDPSSSFTGPELSYLSIVAVPASVALALSAPTVVSIWFCITSIGSTSSMFVLTDAFILVPLKLRLDLPLS